MALERICDVCGEKLGRYPEKYWAMSITERERNHERTFNFEKNEFSDGGYKDVCANKLDICEDCINKIKKEIEK